MRIALLIALAAATGTAPPVRFGDALKRAPQTNRADTTAARNPVHPAPRDTVHFVTDDFVVATVGPRRITALDFRNRYFLGADASRPGQDSLGREEFLDRMVDKEVLGLMVHEVEKPLTFEDRLRMRAHTSTVLQNVLYQRWVLDSVRITNADIDRYMAQYGYEQHLRMILFEDRDTADRARNQLLRGRTSWGEAVRRYSKDKNLGGEGDHGWVKRSTLRGELALRAFELQPGTYSEALLAPEGYRVIQCIGRRPVPVLPLQYARMSLMTDLKQAYARPYANRFYERVRLESGVVYDTTTLRMVAAKFKEQIESAPAVEKFTIDMSPQIPAFDPADTARVMARTKFRTITVGQFLEEMNQVPGALRPQFASLEPLIHALDGPTLTKERLELAIARGIDKDSMAIAQIEKQREQILIDHMYEDSVMAHVNVTTEQRRRYFEERRREMFAPASVLHARFICPDRETSDQLMSQLVAGEKAEDLIKMRHLRGDDSTGSIYTVTERDGDEFTKVLFEELSPGKCSRVGPAGNGTYLVLQVLEHTPRRDLKFDEVGGALDETLSNMQAERLLKDFLSRNRKRYPVKIEHGMIMRIWLTDPTLDYVSRRPD